MITYSNGSFYVKDELAKFGTLLLLREPIAIPFKKWYVSLQLGRFNITVACSKDKSTIYDNFIGQDLVSTYEEDAPFLPQNLISILEKESVKLGLKDHVVRFDDLAKIRDNRISTYHKDEIMGREDIDNSNYGLVNTVRDEIADSQQNIITNQNDLTTIARTRRPDLDLLENTLEMANESARDMPLGYHHDFNRHNNSNMMTQNNDTSLMRAGNNATVPQFQTDLGILTQRENTNNTPLDTTNMGDRSMSNNAGGTDQSSSRMSISSKQIYRKFI